MLVNGKPISEQALTDPRPTAEELLRDQPLYRWVFFGKGDDEYLPSLTNFKGGLDAYCPACGGQSIFRLAPLPVGVKRPMFPSGGAIPLEDLMPPPVQVFQVLLNCSRNNNHTMHCLFLTAGGTAVCKIGQYPSYADVILGDVAKYSKVAGPKFGEFKRALKLASSDVGIGAFVYLRRVFEWLLEEAHQEAKEDAGWEEEAYRKDHIGGKIKRLKRHLAPYVVENASLYEVLSVGLHESVGVNEFTEQDCLKYFPVVKAAIVAMLNERLRLREEAENAREAQNALAELAGELRNRAPGQE